MPRRRPEDADPPHRSARHSTLPRRTLCPPVKSDLPGGPVADIHRAPAARKPPPVPHRLPPPTTATKRTHRNVSNQPPQVSKNQHRLNPLGLGRASKRAIQSPYPPNGVLRLYYNAAGQESPWPARARTQIRRQNFGKAPPWRRNYPCSLCEGSAREMPEAQAFRPGGGGTPDRLPEQEAKFPEVSRKITAFHIFNGVEPGIPIRRARPRRYSPRTA